MRQRAVLLSGVRVPVCPALQKSAALTLLYRVNYTDKTNQTSGQSVIPGAVSGVFFWIKKTDGRSRRHEDCGLREF